MNGNRLRVMLDGRMLIGAFGGICRMVTRVAEELARMEEVEVILLCGDAPYPPFADRHNITLTTSSFSKSRRTAAKRLWWEMRQLPAIIQNSGADVFHATWNTGIPDGCPVPAVLTIHDLIPSRNPSTHFATRMQRWAHLHSLHSSVKNAGVITTVSDYAKQQVLDDLSISPEKVHTVHNGVDLSPIAPAIGNISSSPFVLYVGGHDTRKNTKALIGSMEQYWRTHDSAMELRMTGTFESLCDDARRAFDTCPFKDRIRFLGRLDDGELARQYASARALVFLSTDEGFGLPPLEAMGHGCPVIAANRASLPEVVSNGGILVDPDDCTAVADAIHMVNTNDDTRHRQITAGRRRATRFSWRNAALGFLEMYRIVLQGSEQSPRSLQKQSAAACVI